MNTVRSFLFCTTFLLATSFLQAKEPDALCCVQLKACGETAFAKKLTSLPEWTLFRDVFCDAVDRGIQKELADRSKLEKVLPPEFVGLIAQAIKRYNVSFRDIERAAQHLETIVFAAHANDNGGFDGVLAFIVDIDPSPSLMWLQMLDGFLGKNMFLKQEPNGDFIVNFTFKLQEQKIEFCCAGLKLPGKTNRYALLFSDAENIQRYCGEFKSGRTGEEHAAGYAGKIIVSEHCFRSLEEFGKQHAWAAKTTEVCGKIIGIVFGCRENDGATQLDIRFSLRQAADAKRVHDTLVRLADFVPFLTDTPSAANLSEIVHVELNGTDVVVTIKLDSPEVLRIIGNVLQQTSEELMKKNTADDGMAKE